ncbi:MAG: hypothetical protein A3D96_06005 [Chlamydiae bacterium RIFCSPHIGHO2_12_FULL_44_59]|nr:MAG: hypothetical protein A2796_03830 [Chlamydiae bacterium RIFCSPHIGHO2_01_FULL_44_39]OGN57187.1 MAG: hypothetical protein A3C42_02065 [Chlamydiae bacterium RIFCSPHIGHO2_02_FULL_45_9]OGN61177.1 MAG: hypothetical protein A3D96_06005 [Chlamydiae bacterium RIFCSPHIGHO2_12_FULL_44_59]OGN65647.1 MAG: hypothetical protein A2978_06810 [Chlamydiae bacterium RIFCSPLOWO2_01_FULL_44_52]OGN69013.1 MAG: hypothetical protein A3F79_02100 [Chlamydiae bacterium RIFCSPLOWO2_12_FULL_45_20]
MSVMKKSIIALIVSVSSLFGVSEDLMAITGKLKPRQPNWRMDAVKIYPQGSPQTIVFYEPSMEGDHPVKQVYFYENGQIQSEMDVVLVDEDTAAFGEWNSPIVPHGMRVDFTSDGKLVKTAQFEHGVLHGEVRSYYWNGQLQSEQAYLSGKPCGAAKSYYESGQLKEEAQYDEGLLTGEVVQYYENGNKAAIFPHKAGQVDGMAFSWFPSGALNMERLFKGGKLHGDGKNPALIAYDEERNIIEVLDFRNGEPTGLHVCYYPSGAEKYRLFYKNGKKDGKEQFFNDQGALLGEGEYLDGAPKNRHWRTHLNGALAYQANFNSDGVLLEPIVEYNEDGQKLREFFVLGDRFNGPYYEWYDTGIAKVEYSYQEGEYEGSQKEYYPSGQLKVSSFYKDQKRHGLHEEWYDNGVLARRVHFAYGLKDGQMGEWYSNGNSKIDAYFQKDSPDGVQSEWFEDGQLKRRAEFASGLKEGWHREWNEGGELLFETFFDQDLMDGTMLTWWNRDQVKTSFLFEKGKKQGTHKWFYKNGKPERVVSYRDDLQEGEGLAWYPDGTLQLVQFFQGGLPTGEHRFYFPKDGANQERLAHLFHYDMQGKLHGEEKVFYTDGSLQAVISYCHGLMDGKRQIFDPDGTLKEEANYNRGELKGKFFQKLPDGQEVVTYYEKNLKHGPHCIFYPPNNMMEKVKALEANYQNDRLEGVVIEYLENGQKVVETPYVHGMKEGTAKIFGGTATILTTIDFYGDKRNGMTIEYYPNGALYRETYYFEDRKEGEERSYHKNGNLASVFPYENDQLNGLAQSWNKKGFLVFEAEYVDGLRHGKFCKYYEDGKLLLEETFVADQLEGEKRKYNKEGAMTVSLYEGGKLLKTVH